MSKNTCYAVVWPNAQGQIFYNVKEFNQGMKVSNAMGQGFTNEKDALEWMNLCCFQRRMAFQKDRLTPKPLPDFLVESHAEEMNVPTYNDIKDFGELERVLKENTRARVCLPEDLVIYVEHGTLPGGDLVAVASYYTWEGFPVMDYVFRISLGLKTGIGSLESEALVAAYALEFIQRQTMDARSYCICVGERKLCEAVKEMEREGIARISFHDEAVSRWLKLLFSRVGDSDVRMVSFRKMDERALRAHGYLRASFPKVAFSESLFSSTSMLSTILGRCGVLPHPMPDWVKAQPAGCRVGLPGDLTVYTDGSHHIGRETAAFVTNIYWDGVYAVHIGAAFKADWLNSTKAEILAVVNGLLCLSGARRISIHTDLEQIVETWESGNMATLPADASPTEYDSLLRLLMMLLECHDVSLSWVKGHAGNSKNNIADRQARNMMRTAGEG